MKKLFIAAFLVGSFAVAPMAQASTLTAPQVDALIALLQAFGVEQPTIDIVYSQLTDHSAPQSNPQHTTPMADEPQAAGAPAEEGSLQVSVIKYSQSIAAANSNQILAMLSVLNGTDRTVEISEPAGLGLSVSGGPEGMDTGLIALWLGDKSSQTDITSKPLRIEPGDTATVQVRLAQGPGAAGILTLHVGDESQDISIAAPTE